MLKITKRNVATRTWTAGADLEAVNLPREGLITEVKCRFKPTLTGAGVSGEDLFFGGGQNYKIQGDGGRTYLGLSGEEMTRLLAYLNMYDFGAPMINLQGTVAATNTTPSCSWVFHPGSNPKDPFDMSAVIPARALSTLQALLTTCAADINAGDTITGGTYYWEIHEVLGVPVPKGIMTPLGSTLMLDLAATYSDFSLKQAVPAGAWLRRIIMLQEDDTAVPLRTDAEVTGVKLEFPREAGARIESNWDDLVAEAAIRSGIACIPGQVAGAAATATATCNTPTDGVAAFLKGFAVLDLRKYFHPIYGANLIGYQTGDVQLGLTVASAVGNLYIYWDQLMPVEDQYVGK